MKKITFTLGKEVKNIEVVALSDLHYGDPLCDLEFIKNKIDYIKNNENVYCLLNGDLINNATKQSVSDVYSELKTPQQQIEDLTNMFRPIKDKIIAVCSGN